MSQESSAEIIAIIKDHAKFCKTTFAWWEGEHQNEMNMTHTVIGIVGELAELDLSEDIDNYTEELGDIFYYLCMLHALTDEVPIDIDLGFRDTNEIIDIYITALKKMVFYKHRVQPDVKYILGWMHNQMNWRNITFKSIAVENKAKLQRRYASGKFSSQEAANRADKN
jgi:NTP pyrophosphatase (non-canonical NTP hydrolase)